MTDQRHENVINLDELETQSREQGRFGSAFAIVGDTAGGKHLGCNLFEVKPGMTAFPNHFHCGVEEAIFIIKGQGTLRIGDDEVTVRQNDWIAFPPGPEHAHQLLNDSEEVLRYLCISDRAKADVVGYPDSGKIGAMAASDPTRWFETSTVRGFFRKDSTVDYYDGEDVEE